MTQNEHLSEIQWITQNDLNIMNFWSYIICCSLNSIWNAGNTRGDGK